MRGVYTPDVMLTHISKLFFLASLVVMALSANAQQPAASPMRRPNRSLKTPRYGSRCRRSLLLLRNAMRRLRTRSCLFDGKNVDEWVNVKDKQPRCGMFTMA